MPSTIPTEVVAAIATGTFRIVTNTMTHTSPLSGHTQTVEFPGQRWRLDWTFKPLQSANADIMKAFLISLNGRAGRFYGFDPAKRTPRGVGTGTPLVNGASQTGTTLITDGWTTSQTGIMKKGDYFAVNGELKMITEDCNSDGSGNATLTFGPALRNSPGDNNAITVTNPVTTFMLDMDDPGWDVDQVLMYGFTLSAIEAFF